MSIYPLKTVYFHEGASFHMSGKNFGTRVDMTSGAKIVYDREAKEIHISYNGKTSTLSSLSAKNWDYIETPAFIAELFKEEAVKAPEAPKRGRGRPPMVAPAPIQTTQSYPEVPMPDFDPNDLEAAAKHRALVRAASANSNKPEFRGPQNDDLIQAARTTAMGLKHQKTAQVQTAQQVGELAGVSGKRKVMSHAELRAQVAKEAKE